MSLSEETKLILKELNSFKKEIKEDITKLYIKLDIYKDKISEQDGKLISCEKDIGFITQQRVEDQASIKEDMGGFSKRFDQFKEDLTELVSKMITNKINRTGWLVSSSFITILIMVVGFLLKEYVLK